MVAVNCYGHRSSGACAHYYRGPHPKILAMRKTILRPLCQVLAKAIVTNRMRAAGRLGCLDSSMRFMPSAVLCLCRSHLLSESQVPLSTNEMQFQTVTKTRTKSLLQTDLPYLCEILFSTSWHMLLPLSVCRIKFFPKPGKDDTIPLNGDSIVASKLESLRLQQGMPWPPCNKDKTAAQVAFLLILTIMKQKYPLLKSSTKLQEMHPSRLPSPYTSTLQHGREFEYEDQIENNYNHFFNNVF